MFTPNPEYERIRAQSILRSFTEQKEAVNLFAPTSSPVDADCEQAKTTALAANHNHDRSLMRVFKAIRLTRRESVQQPASYSPRQVTTSNCP